MRASRSELIRRILIVLDGNPSSIYDILYSLNDFSDPKRTRLPKLLKAMEKEGLVTSALQPGPLGPYRRIYEHGPKASEYLMDQLKCGIETLMHFYVRFRWENKKSHSSLPEESEVVPPEGSMLFTAYPNLTVDQLERIREIVTAQPGADVSIVGPDQLLSRSGIDYRVVGQTLSRIETPDNHFSYIQLDGVPPRPRLAAAVSEFERILKPGGVVRILTAMAFFEEPKRPNLEQFVRITASSLFPEVGIVEGNDVVRILDNTFGASDVCTAKEGGVVFIARKS